jgi:Fic family protein
MDKARASHFSDPGEFRKSQNWIGGTRPDNARFVPPPVREMNIALNELELFLHAEDSMPTVIKAGLIHAQFETIHPFLDGNGRTGRMLITFYLWRQGFLENPVLFLSSYFKKNQTLYYEKLFGYHCGKVSEWIEFFLDGIIEITHEAIAIIDKITLLREKDMQKIQILGKRAAESAVGVLRELYKQPIVNNAFIQQCTNFTRAGAQTVINRFIKIGILRPMNENKKYGQSYFYKEYIDIFIGPPESKTD